MISQINDRDLISMKLIHYFITKMNYNPIIVQGVENEIWLENLNAEYKVLRIVNNYIHNDEQMNFDVFKTKRMIKKIKKKTFTFKIKVLNILTDVGDNVDREKTFDGVDVIIASCEDDILNNEIIKTNFPDLKDSMQFSEEGFQLFLKITEEINNKNRQESMETDHILEPKTPIITYILMGLMTLLFGLDVYFKFSLSNRFCLYGDYIRNGEYWRLITGMFFHSGFIHLLCNLYALWIIGRQIESYYGRIKYLIIYLISSLCGALLFIAMSDLGYSIGASASIFGLMGSMIYFGYNYRIYFSSVLMKQLIYVVAINLLFSILVSSIDIWGYIGGLIGGILVSKAVGVNSKNSKSSKINGWIITSMFVIFLVILGIFMK